jgi:hypothetical protein
VSVVISFVQEDYVAGSLIVFLMLTINVKIYDVTLKLAPYRCAGC